MQKIDYTNKHGIMVGYIDNSQNVVAVETGWKTTPEALTGVLMNQYNSKEMAQELVDSPTLMPTFKKTIIGMLMDLVMLLNQIYLGIKKR